MLVYCYLNVILIKIKVLFFFPSQIRMFSKIKNRTLIWIKFLKLEALLHLIEYFKNPGNKPYTNCLFRAILENIDLLASSGNIVTSVGIYLYLPHKQ